MEGFVVSHEQLFIAVTLSSNRILFGGHSTIKGSHEWIKISKMLAVLLEE